MTANFKLFVYNIYVYLKYTHTLEIELIFLSKLIYFLNVSVDYCMVDFIRPNLLGSLKDFTNRFINPITNGQYSDSTPLDVELMKGRSHVLHKMLEGFVQVFFIIILIFTKKKFS